MADTSELMVLQRALDQLRSAVDSVQQRYGDIPPVRRILGDVERITLDVGDLDGIEPPIAAARPPLQPIDDTPPDPSLWADADDEGIGGYHGPAGNRAASGRSGHRLGGPLGGRASGGAHR